MDKMQTLHSFWSGFGLKAYDQTVVPDDAVLPYITYEAASDDWGHDLYLTASLWYRTTSWTEITFKSQEIANYISRGGRLIPFDGGTMWIRMRAPWAQRMSDEDGQIRRIVLSITIEFLD